jgi:hypothetical protein
MDASQGIYVKRMLNLASSVRFFYESCDLILYG